MKYLKAFLFFLIPAAIYSCNYDNHGMNSIKYIQETNQFNTYLQEHFSMSLPADSNTFVLLSSSGCSGCVKSFLNTLTRPVRNLKVHYIVPNKLLEKEHLNASLLNSSIMIDQENRVDRLPYHNGNIAIIESVEGTIYNVYKIEPYQTDSILTLLNK